MNWKERAWKNRECLRNFKTEELLKCFGSEDKGLPGQWRPGDKILWKWMRLCFWCEEIAEWDVDVCSFTCCCKKCIKCKLNLSSQTKELCSQTNVLMRSCSMTLPGFSTTFFWMTWIPCQDRFVYVKALLIGRTVGSGILGCKKRCRRQIVNQDLANWWYIYIYRKTMDKLLGRASLKIKIQ